MLAQKNLFSSSTKVTLQDINMTLKHIALLAFKEYIEKEDIIFIMKSVADLQKKIPQILSFSWGENLGIEGLDHGYLHGFMIEFKNIDDKNVYLQHPEHIKLVNEVINPALRNSIHSILVFDSMFDKN
jgi:Stress responsive A/B Barrel Domain